MRLSFKLILVFLSLLFFFSLSHLLSSRVFAACPPSYCWSSCYSYGGDSCYCLTWSCPAGHCQAGCPTACCAAGGGDVKEFPELAPWDLSYSPSSPKKGDSMSFSATVKNWDDATADSKASMTRLRLDVNNDGSWNWKPANQPTGVLAPGATEIETWSGWIAVVGTHKFEVCVDVTDVNNEANEDNNCKSKTFTVAALPDLIVSRFQIRTAGCGPLLSGCAQPGEDLCARVTIKNRGNARAGVSQTGFRKRAGLEYEKKRTSALDLGETETKDFLFTALDTARDYTARAVADIDTTVDESDEGNNAIINTYCVEAAPIPPPLNCVCGSWQDAGCGGWTCASDEMYQVQFCFWSDGSGLCQTNKQCVADPTCQTQGWFQTQEGDVHAQGNISVPVVSGEYFSENGSGGTPGVVSRSGSADFSPGRVSSTGWLANTSFSRKKYDYFYQLLGSPTVDNFNDLNNITADGVYYSVDNVDINAGFPGGRKAMVLVNGNVDIKTNIDVPIGSFLAIIASGKIDIADSVSRVEGIFIADGAFDAGTAATALTAEGMFVTNSFDLDGRDLGALNESTPAIKFIYRPDFWLNAPAELLIPSYTWQELAP